MWKNKIIFKGYMNIFAPQKLKNMEKYNKLKELIATIEVDAEKFYVKGSKAAGTRVRSGMQEIKVLAQEIRNEVTEIKNKPE
jgi:hypothetical protein